MQPIASMCRSVWWAFAAAGALALAAAVVAGLQIVAPPIVTGAWQLVSGVLLLVAAVRAPGGIRSALPILGAAAVGILLGIAVAVFPSNDPRVALSIIGIWSLITGAGYLAISRIARAFKVPDGGLYPAAWAAILAGVVISTFPAFGLGNVPLAPAAALAAVGAITIAASTRLRTLPDEAPPVLSNREARRRGRAGGR